jgi:hypothetical protein
VPNYATHYSGFAQALARQWAATIDRLLRPVGSNNNLLYGMLIYLPVGPRPMRSRARI